MQRNKIYELLKTLKKKEIKRFDAYLKYDHGSTNQPYKIFQYIKKYHPRYESNDLNKEVVIQETKVEVVNKKSIDNYYSKIYKSLLDFLVLQKLKVGSFNRDQLLFQIFKERGQSQAFHRQLKIAKSNILTSKANGINLFSYYNEFLLHYISYFEGEDVKTLLNINNNNMLLLTKNFELFFSAACLRCDIELINIRRILKEEHEDINQNSNLIASSSNSLYHHIYLKIYQFLKSEGNQKHQDFDQLLLQILEAGQQIDQAEKAVMLDYLLNICSDRIKRGDASYFEKAFKVYEKGFQKKLFQEITTTKFTNIIDVASYVGAFSWLNNFMQLHFDIFPKEEMNNLLNLSNAQIAFQKHKYQQVITLLQTVQFENIYFKIRGRALEIRASFELNEDHKKIKSLCKSFEDVLKRDNKINAFFKEGYLNFIKILRMFLQEESQKSILEEVKILRLVQFKKWLLEKITAPK